MPDWRTVLILIEGNGGGFSSTGLGSGRSKIGILFRSRLWQFLEGLSGLGNGTCQVETFQNGSFRFVSGSCQLIF